MDVINETNQLKERKSILSTLWIFLSANYIFCDVLSNMEPEFLKQLVQGGQIANLLLINQEFLLGAAIFMEIPFLMIILSRILKYKINRWANIIAGILLIFVQIGSLFFGTKPTLHYIFYSIIEIVCLLIIIWYSFSWRYINNHTNNS